MILNNKLNLYLVFFLSIVLEVIGTTLLKKTNGFTKFLPSIGTLVAYSIAFYCMSIVMKHLPIGIVYATWSALGIILTSIIAFFIYKQALDMPAILGMGLIILGVLIMNLLSKSSA